LGIKQSLCVLASTKVAQIWTSISLNTWSTN